MKKKYDTAKISIVEIDTDIILSSSGLSTTWQPTASTVPMEPGPANPGN